MTIPHLMRRQQLEERLGLTRSSIYKMMDDGEFPRPMKIGRRAVGWRADEIAQWLERQQSIGLKSKLRSLWQIARTEQVN